MDFNVETITYDSEDSLINAIKFVFPKVNRVGCYFHYKMDIIRNLRIYNLYNIFNSDGIISKLRKLPLIYKGDMINFDEFIKSGLGNKKIVNWVIFINFLKNESETTKKKLIEIANQNVKFSKNKSKFRINKNKKRSKSYVLESDENNWLTTKNSSCRYDAFITMFALSKNQIYNPFINPHINFIIEIITKILKKKNENYKFIFGKN